MFESTEHHRQVLDRETYSAPEQFQREVDTLFKPAWHCIGSAADFPQDGDYRTLNLMGYPLIVWRYEGQFHTFLNVCAHRYCLLTHQECGNLQKLKCQYHGWEYDETGNTQRIPDAKSFRPMEQGMLGLKRYRTERCGQLVFINLSEAGPSLAEWMGDDFERFQDWFSNTRIQTISHTMLADANWKVLVENSIESYHSTEIHPKTFGPYPDEELCRHDLKQRGTLMTVNYADDPAYDRQRRLDRFAHRVAGIPPKYEYQHAIVYPALMGATMSLFTHHCSILPISPSKSQWIFNGFCNMGERRGTGLRKYALTAWHRRFVRKFNAEDHRVFAPIQTGMSAPDEPNGGLISTREERVTHFQKFVHQATQNSSAPCRGECNGPFDGEQPADLVRADST